MPEQRGRLEARLEHGTVVRQRPKLRRRSESSDRFRRWDELLSRRSNYTTTPPTKQRNNKSLIFNYLPQVGQSIVLVRSGSFPTGSIRFLSVRDGMPIRPVQAPGARFQPHRATGFPFIVFAHYHTPIVEMDLELTTGLTGIERFVDHSGRVTWK
jgi:hypothetical protein